jgi:uncharacterized membrane protein YraQ (UPF0718 family)
MQYIQDISIVCISILFEAFPFIMLGVVVSSIIHEFVPDDFIPKIMPKNPFLGALVGVIMGLFIPVCDCAVIPISRRLMKKGIPLNVGITFMLASPIINPIVIFATIYSFGTIIPKMVIYRSILGVIIAIIIGLIISVIHKKDEVFLIGESTNNSHSSACNCGCHHEHKKKKLFERILNVVKHSKVEFFEIIKYLIIGSLIASSAQVLIPKEILNSFSGEGVIQIFILMIFAYLISLCSTSDSFVAKAFANQFSNNSILAFLLLGPMIDVKNTIVLLGNYNKKFVIKLIGLIFLFVFAFALIVNI